MISRRSAFFLAALVGIPALLWRLNTAQETFPVQPGSTPDAPGLAVQWSDLLPPDWDPLKRFRSLPLATLSDNSPEAQALMRDMRETWNNAPTNARLDGVRVQLSGYVVPLEATAGELTEFLLVPFFGACIHSPPPPSNQIVHVQVAQVLPGLRMMDAVRISGLLQAQRRDTVMGVSGYEMAAAQLARPPAHAADPT
jgi:uncharacterized protein